MKSYKKIFLLCFVLSINITCFSTNNDAEESNLPSYDDTVKSGILKNADNVPPPDYNEARTRDYLVAVPPGSIGNENLRYTNSRYTNINYMPKIQLSKALVCVLVASTAAFIVVFLIGTIRFLA